MPSKKDSKYVIILYLVVNLLSLSSGQRGGAVLAIIFLVTYFFIRNRVNPGEKALDYKARYNNPLYFDPYIC